MIRPRHGGMHQRWAEPVADAGDDGGSLRAHFEVIAAVQAVDG